MKNLAILFGLALILAMAHAASAAIIPVETTFGGRNVVSFMGDGTDTWTVPTGVTSLDILVVGGGGSGGQGGGGGGGAGGLIYQTGVSVTPLSVETVMVGAGGAAVTGANGQDSSFLGYTAIGGGYGGCANYGNNPSTGGSGGGGQSDKNVAGAAGTAGQGNSGGRGMEGGGWSVSSGGGGGGAGAVGAGANNSGGGAGGIGLDFSSIFGPVGGASGWFAGGGGGGAQPATKLGGAGGLGGGGAGAAGDNSIGVSGIPSTGGGGGGGGENYIAHLGRPSSAGGSGIVVLSYEPAALPEIKVTGQAGSWQQVSRFSAPETLYVEKDAKDLGPFDLEIEVTGGINPIDIQEAVLNSTGEAWADYHFQLGTGLAEEFLLADPNGELYFTGGASDVFSTSGMIGDPHPTELAFSGGSLGSGNMVNFLTTVHLPDGDPYMFTLRQWPTLPSTVIPEPSTLLVWALLGLLGLGLGRRRRG